MTNEESRQLLPGLYRIKWASGGESLAAVGIMRSGVCWYAPTNWTSEFTNAPMIASTEWSRVESVEAINPEEAKKLQVSVRELESVIADMREDSLAYQHGFNAGAKMLTNPYWVVRENRPMNDYIEFGVYRTEEEAVNAARSYAERSPIGKATYTVVKKYEVAGRVFHSKDRL